MNVSTKGSGYIVAVLLSMLTWGCQESAQREITEVECHFNADCGSGQRCDQQTKQCVSEGDVVSPDVSTDSSDTAPDVAVDTSPDVPPDVSMDTTQDTPTDTTPDLGPTCDFVGMETIFQQGLDVDETSSIQYFSATDVPTSDQSFDLILFEWRFASGAFRGPHVFEFEEGVDYSTCVTCAIIAMGCGVEDDCQRFFLPVSGMLTVGAMGQVGELLAGELTGARFEEVEFDVDTFETRPLEGGASWCLDYFAFNVVLGR